MEAEDPTEATMVADTVQLLLDECKRVGRGVGHAILTVADMEIIVAALRSAARVAKLEARLEIDHHYVMAPEGDPGEDGTGLARVPGPIPGVDPDAWDGIECRDATIKLLEGKLKEARRKAAHYRRLAVIWTPEDHAHEIDDPAMWRDIS